MMLSNDQQKINNKRTRPRKDFEIKFYENILKDRPDCVCVLGPLGDAYTRKGFYKEGLAVDKKLVTLKPDDPIAYYNLACSLSLLGRPQEGLEALKKAVLFGYDDFVYMKKDSDLENIRKLVEYETFSHKLKKLK